MKKIGIIYNPTKDKAMDEVSKLKKWIAGRYCKAIAVSSAAKKFPHFDFAITLGGDGTMLKASRLLAPAGIPVLGINLGSLGFMAETSPGEAFAFIKDVISDRYEIENRIMLNVTLRTKTRVVRNIALNDIVVHSGTIGRIVKISTEINGEYLATYIGDGVIVSTPTGSTAYSLAASGPIVYPKLEVLVITPVCPHTLTQRPLIVSAAHSLKLKTLSKDSIEKPTLTIDGQIKYALSSTDEILVETAEHPLKLIVNPRHRYLSILRTKLKWGERG